MCITPCVSKNIKTGGKSMKKEKTKGIFLEVVGKLLNHEAKSNASKSPPMCMGIFHQPKRPKAVKTYEVK